MITKLDSHTVQRISSGQLILDIPTALKELIENAIDANSTQISLTIEDDGLSSLSCRDNGMGIPVGDRQYLGQRHATSKITCFEDIDSVRSYGFRGEAIASLCVIGDISLTTRVEREETARTYEFDHDGNIVSEKASAGQRGTAITIRNLFGGTPVRLAQLKKHRLSLGKVKSLVMSYALVRHIRFSLLVRGNKRLDWTVQASSDAMSVATSVYGKEFIQRYTNLSWSSDGIIIKGILPNSKDGWSKLGNTNVDTMVLDKQLQTHYIYIDNRPVSLSRNPAKQFLKLLSESYSSDRNLQSSFIYLNLHCDVDKVKYDCNMDPSKSEVIFEKFEIVCECFKKFLNEVHGISSMRSPSPVPVDFFTPERGSSRLLSPPPSSPVLPVRNVYSVEENYLNKMTPQKNLRQTLLDEYRSPHTPTERTNQDARSFVNERPSEGDTAALRSMMGCSSKFDGIDLTQGIISGRQPRKTTNPLGNHSLEAFRARFDMNGHHPMDAIQKQHSSRNTRSVTKQSSTPRKLTARVVKSPRTPQTRNPVRKELLPQSPPSSHTPIKYRSISESPGLEYSLNPWTIASLSRDPKRARLDMNVTHRVGLYEDDDVFAQTIQPDMDLQTLIVVCEISMEEVAAGQVVLLSQVPPACDLMDILLQYYHDFEISTR